MISMSNVSSPSAAGGYYAEDNYYSQDENQASSQWLGAGAEELGLHGEIELEQFQDVLSGKVGDQQLGRWVAGEKDAQGNPGEPVLEHRPGIDVTLSAPKSVSLIAEVGGAGDMRQAHEAAVKTVLDYIEKNLIGARVTVAGETRFEQTDNLIAARFQHTTSRDLDPQTHTHLVIANATQTADGVWRSMSNEGIYSNKGLIASIYDTELAANIRALGYRVENTADGRWEVAGISREQIEHFSQRSQAIEERLDKFGLTRESATAAQRESAALLTRAAKGEVDHVALREEWRERAAAIGIDFAKIEAERAINADKQIPAAQTAEMAVAAVKFAVDHLTERESVVDHKEVVHTALNHAIQEKIWASVRLSDVTAVIEQRIEEKSVLHVEARPDPHRLERDQITTPLALEREQVMLGLLQAGRGATPSIQTENAVGKAIEAFEARKSAELGIDFKMTVGQVQAAIVALTSQDQFVGLQGYAGVGKTTMLEIVKESAEAAGWTVIGMASSAEAAQTLEKDSGISSVTTARFLLDESKRAAESMRAEKVEVQLHGAVDTNGNDYRSMAVTYLRERETPAPRQELWVVDESSLMSQREATTIMERAAAAGAKVVMVGDKLQLNAVEAGKPFELLQRAGIQGAEMTEINRQQVDDMKMAVAAAVARDNGAALAHLSERIVENKDKPALLQQVANDMVAKHGTDRTNALLIVPLNEHRETINNLVRERLQEIGTIQANATTREVLVPTGFTDPQKGSFAYYSKEMTVRFGRDYKSLGVERGDYAQVVGVDFEKRVVNLALADGTKVSWDPTKQSKVEVYEREGRHLAIGDEIRFTRNNSELGVNNGTLARVESISGGKTVLATKDGQVTLDAKDAQHRHWDYAYAMTVYASQGKTVADSNILITKDSGRAMGDRAFYVGITRPRTDLTIYTDDRGKALALIKSVQEKSSAMEALKIDLGDGAKTQTETAGKNSGSGGKGAMPEL